MITTKNRQTELCRTLQFVRQLNPPPVEVLITADGCTDDTLEMLNAGVQVAGILKLKVIVNEVGRGSVASRDWMLREAKGDLVLALDDDSYPEQVDCLARLSQLFAGRPELALAHFPQRTDEYPATLHQIDFGLERPTNSFPNSGACYRRSAYLVLPGFYGPFSHMYEEPDYALQCIAEGYDVLFTPIVTIRHHWSGQSRSEIRNHHRHSRNEWWSVWLRCPWPYAVLLLVYRPFSQLRYAAKRGFAWVIREPQWWWDALKGVPQCLRDRRPIHWTGYSKWLRAGEP